MPLTRLAAASAASRSPTFVSSARAKGSSWTGVSKVPRAGGRSSRTTGWRSAVAEARAIRTASAATRSTSAASRRWELAKPHAPPTRTRTPKPSLSPDATPSTRPDLIAIDSSRRRTILMSAYVAPRPAAVSRARSVRSRIGRQGSRRLLADEPSRPSEGPGADDRLARHDDADDDDDDGGDRRREEGDASEGRPRRAPGQPAAGVHEPQAGAAEDDGHAGPEGDDEHEPVCRPARGECRQQDDQRIDRGDEPAEQPQREQAPPGQRLAGRREMAVLDAAVTVHAVPWSAAVLVLAVVDVAVDTIVMVLGAAARCQPCP